ncbi:MAG TPA: hypothetical protein VFW38_03235 [Solirubrobacteraceae bacterium]|nr:hypothetical protein [Solirubrobacteraceae bacterium]
MHAQPSGCPQPATTHRDPTADTHRAESAILALLLGEDHHGLWSREELQRYTSAGPLDTTDAIAELIANGLAHELNGFILASRAARSFDCLEL